MKKRIPPDAYAFYLSLGVSRSYSAVAEKYGVSKRAVAFCAEREGWQKKLAADEGKVREKAERAAAENIQTLRDQDLKVIRFGKGRCVETLKTLPIESATDAIKTYMLLVKAERELRGDPETNASRLEEITRDEIRTLLTTQPAGTDGPDDY